MQIYSVIYTCWPHIKRCALELKVLHSYLKVLLKLTKIYWKWFILTTDYSMRWLVTDHESGEKERTKMSEQQEFVSTFPLSPFIGKVKGEIFTVSPSRACILSIFVLLHCMELLCSLLLHHICFELINLFFSNFFLVELLHFFVIKLKLLWRLLYLLLTLLFLLFSNKNFWS